ncbi:MAG: hypothetical protein ACRDIB_15710 [Ardenticatenaceae bacterium]
MTQDDILDGFKQLSLQQQLEVIAEAVQILQRGFSQAEEPAADVSQKAQLAAAAQALLPDYLEDEELTAFVALDGEPFDA